MEERTWRRDQIPPDIPLPFLSKKPPQASRPNQASELVVGAHCRHYVSSKTICPSP
ncbi:hypothetical protein N656DRAFT_781868 [Canariomyces notabilis]|uniref:Uncharacterized protein n=1 Tax=Canariomyces notabilis TaxID=2074819 RepID=A0AAN6QHB0_9PEZI|nr:hypothetical protein N656DRAFT_781868 [Canariomyces arenarius]